jgi:hypothetical protein
MFLVDDNDDIGDDNNENEKFHFFVNLTINPFALEMDI